MLTAPIGLSQSAPKIISLDKTSERCTLALTSFNGVDVDDSKMSNLNAIDYNRWWN